MKIYTKSACQNPLSLKGACGSPSPLPPPFLRGAGGIKEGLLEVGEGLLEVGEGLLEVGEGLGVRATLVEYENLISY
jgi:hypothetical protein